MTTKDRSRLLGEKKTRRRNKIGENRDGPMLIPPPPPPSDRLVGLLSRGDLLALPPAVEEDVGLLGDDARGLRAGDGGVVVVEPVARGVVEGGGGVVSAAEAAGVLRDGEEVVAGAGGVVFGEDEGAEVEVLEGKVHQVVELLAVDEVHGLVVLEAFQVEDQDVGRRPEVQLLEGAVVLLALGAEPLLGLAELLPLRQGPQAVHDVDLLGASDVALRRGLVHGHGLVLRAVVPLLQRLARPLQRQELVRLQRLAHQRLVLRQLRHQLRPRRRRRHHAVRLRRRRRLHVVVSCAG
mmetsp:Transcript_11922/g.35822  ORF Transcript_11922/g.35822 Transcript_11922/m.35822 type:complete len:294 (+) Transcript_11922:165-1046(+)